MSKVICFYLGWCGSILQIRTNTYNNKKIGSKSWLLTCSSNITLSLPLYTDSALKRELNFCNSCIFEPIYFFLSNATSKWFLTTFFFAFLHTIKLPQYIWKGNLLLLKCIPSFSHERRILGPLLECRLWLAVVHPTVKYTTISAVFCRRIFQQRQIWIVNYYIKS